MADRDLALTTVKGGINRLRTKGAALSDSLYDLLNGYVTAARTVKVRPGTVRYANLDFTTLGPDATKGLASFDGNLHIFTSLNEAMVMPEGFVLHRLQHPDGPGPDGSVVQLKKIHFASPFMGFLYVVAEFEETDPPRPSGSVFHFWLQTGDVWQANTTYKLGDIVSPSTPNGFAYQATRLTAPNPSWAPNVPRALGDVVEPTVYNDFYYTVVEALGANPRSGATEPVWPTEDGAQVNEDAEGDYDSSGAVTPQPDPSETPNPNTAERYE